MKVATIGTSFITEWFLTAVEQNEGVECITIHSRSEAKGKALADKFHVGKVYTNVDEMLSDEQIDTVYVASPNALHYDYALQAMEAGKNVICEKPFTSTTAELDHLTAVAKAKKLFLFEAIVTVHMPNFKTLQKHIEELGNLRMVQCNFSQYSSRYDKFLAGENPNIFNPEFSGGALGDLNIYNIHFTMKLFGKPKQAQYFPNIAENGIDTSGVLVLDYGSFKSVCVACKDSRSKNSVQIQGEKGYVYIESESSKCDNMTMHIKDQETLLSVEQNPIALYYELGDFIKIINEKDYDTCYEMLNYSRDVLEVVEHVRKAAGIVFKADSRTI